MYLSTTLFFLTTSPQNKFPHEIKSGKGLTELYNKQVVDAQRVERPLSSSGSKLGSAFGLNHEGVVLRTEDGGSWLVHKGPGYGSTGGNTVVTNAKEMSSQWENVGRPMAIPRDGKMTIGDAVSAGGTHYDFLGNNCWDCADRVMNKVEEAGKVKEPQNTEKDSSKAFLPIGYFFDTIF